MTDTETAPVEEPTPAAPADPNEVTTPAIEVPESVTMPKAEADALRRRVAEAEKAQRKFEADRKKAEEDRQAEQGKWQELAEQRDRELNTERAERARVEREQRITRVAGRLKYLDPSDVIGRITADEGADDASVEAALQRIAETSPHLIAKERPATPEIGQVLEPSATAAAGVPQPPPGKAALRTMEDVEGLSDKEFDARYDEVQVVLKSTQ
jgi:hypothetical protein